MGKMMSSIRTPQIVLVLLGSLILALLGVFVSVARANTADELWNKYRVNIISLLQGRYGHYAHGLRAFGSNVNLDQTVLHIVTNPIEATWNRDISDLSSFAGYVPKWQSEWDSTPFTVSNTVAEKYKRMLFSMANKSLASQHYAQSNSAPKSFEESPHYERLQQFVQRMNGKTTHDVHFVVEEGSGSTTIQSPWGVKTSPFSHMSSIVRELRVPETGRLADENDSNKATFVDFNLALEQDEDAQAQLREFIKKSFQDGHVEEEVEAEDEEESYGELRTVEDLRRMFLNRLIIQQPVIIKSKKFHMDFKAVGLIGIPVRAPFVDRAFIRQQRSQFQGNWFGANGQFNLLPSIVWVALKPQCTLRLSESEFHTMQQHWNSGRALGMAIGGVFFRNSIFRQMALSDMGNEVLGDLFSHSALEYMRQSGDLEDEASFQVKALDADGNEVAIDAGDKATFTVKEDSDEDNEPYIDIDDDEEIDHMESLYSSLSQIIFRFVVPELPPSPPPQIIEKVYEASFKSNSDVPQVLAITSDIL